MTETTVQRVFEDVSVDSKGTIVDTGIAETKLIGILLTASDTADYALDVSADRNTYFDAEETYSGTDEIRDVFEVTERYLRIRVTSAASASTTADIYISGVE